MASPLASNDSGMKRKRDDGESSTGNPGPAGGKQVIQEGMSWWTCLMLDMSHDKSKPHGFHIMEDYKMCEACQPLRPVEPAPTDCCGQGCEPCILDIHQQELELWRKQCWESHGGGKLELCENSAVMNSDMYTSCQLTTIEKITHDSFQYTFTLPEDCHLDISIGMHLILRQVSPSGGVVTRQYTPISPPGIRKTFTILIKLYEDGHMSRVITGWRAGHTVADWRGPVGSFSYNTNQYSHIYLLAAGTGITPMYQIIRRVVEDEQEETIVKLLYASRTQDDVLLREQLNELASYWNFDVIYFLSDEASRNRSYGETVHYERISKSTVEEEVSEVQSCLAIVCGTREFEGDMKTHLMGLGIPEERIVRF